MKHWKPYIERQKSEYTSVVLPPELEAGMIVVIPCFDEPDLFQTLHSLRACLRPKVNVLTVVVFNSGEHSNEKAITQNRLSYDQARFFEENYSEPCFHFYPLLFERLPRKHAGVGLARKIGMDLAVAHFLQIENPWGIIVSLDADCTVSDNYLVTIEDAFSRDSHLNATVHNFLHRVGKNESVPENAVRQYEDYIRYFREMLKQTGFPSYYHTIGSAFAVTADAYVRVGGMGRQQGGEDFYFLQKVFALGHIKELNDTFVYPMARFSDRVPFGTGPALQKIMEEPDGIMKVYSRESFSVLRELFEMKDSFFRKENEEVFQMIRKLDPCLIDFIYHTGFLEDIAECNRNSASLATFQKRFFHHFNAFRIIQFLNFAHPSPFLYEKISMVVNK